MAVFSDGASVSVVQVLGQMHVCVLYTDGESSPAMDAWSGVYIVLGSLEICLS